MLAVLVPAAPSTVVAAPRLVVPPDEPPAPASTPAATARPPVAAPAPRPAPAPTVAAQPAPAQQGAVAPAGPGTAPAPGRHRAVAIAREGPAVVRWVVLPAIAVALAALLVGVTRLARWPWRLVATARVAMATPVEVVGQATAPIVLGAAAQRLPAAVQRDLVELAALLEEEDVGAPPV